MIQVRTVAFIQAGLLENDVVILDPHLALCVLLSLRERIEVRVRR
jgi:hypothetical protein